MWVDDQILSQCDKDVFLSVWRPKSQMVVLGASNKAELELSLENCRSDGVEVLRRYGGGGTVVLYPGCLVVSLGCWVEKPFQNDYYFQLLNGAVIECLAQNDPQLRACLQRGISDICWNERKFAGTSMFRSRGYLLYQASLIVDLDIARISRYLAHPSREPDYREGRKHKDFLIGLSQVCAIECEQWSLHFRAKFEQVVRDALGDELVAPVKAHQKHLFKRAGESGCPPVSPKSRESLSKSPEVQ